MEFNSVTVVRPYEQIVTQIQGAIREGQFVRGARLPTERELAESFGVSRSVVREAVKVLGAMGLVESRQGSGLYVRNNTIQTVSRAFILSVSPDTESVDRLFEFRQGLEEEAARRAAERRSPGQINALRTLVDLGDTAVAPQDWIVFGDADSRFHEAIAEASGNPYLRVAIVTARDMQRDVVSLFSDHPGSMREAVNHHRAIVETIAAQDPVAAAARMGQHIQYTSTVVQSQIPDSIGDQPERIEPVS